MQLQDAVVLCVVIVAVDLEIQMHLHQEVDNAAKDFLAVGVGSQGFDILFDDAWRTRKMNLVDPVVADAVSPSADASQGLGDRLGRYIGSVLAGTQLLDNLMVRRKNPFPMPSHPSDGRNSDQLTQLQMQEQQSPEAANEPVGQALGLDLQNGEDANGPNVPTHGSVHESGEHACEPIEATHGLVENTTQPTHDLVHQVADVDSFSDASQRGMDFINVEQEFDHEPKQHAKPFPLDGLYLNSQEKGYGDSTLMSSSEQQSPVYNRPENNLKAKGSPCIVNPVSTRSSDPAQIENEPVKLSSGDTRSGFHQDSENQQRQQWRVCPQKQCPPTGMNAQMVSSRGDSPKPLPGENPQVQGNSSTTNSWPPQNLQQQNFVSENQLLPQAQMAQFPAQNAGQYGKAAYDQAYYQMMENYFLQQQYMIAQHHYQWQQQFMQLQQVQQPYQQQQQHQLYLQQQQHLAQFQYQQWLQLQEQQSQLMQQQVMNTHQHQNQFYNQYMQLQEQNPMQQHQRMQHQQQIISPQFPTWNSSYYQELSSLQNFSSSHSRVESGQQFASQGQQQVMSPQSAGASGSSQQQLRGITPLHPASAYGSAVSPYNQLQPSRRVTPHGGGAPRPSPSSENQRNHNT